MLPYLLKQIQDKSNKQADVAKLYAHAIVSHEVDDNWPEINQAIVSRWSVSGLKRVKKMAWGYIEIV